MVRQTEGSTLLGWHTRFARNPCSMVGLHFMPQAVCLPDSPGGLGFIRQGKLLLATGDPLAPARHWPDLVRALLSHARYSGSQVCFAPVTADFARVAAGPGMQAVRLGSTPYIHLQDWPAPGRAGADVRHARRRALREGLTLERVHPPFTPEWRREVEQLSRCWQGEHRAGLRLHWVCSLRPLEFAPIKRYFAARVQGRLVAIIAASPLPARDGWYLEDVIRTLEAPTYAGTALVSYALEVLKFEGAKVATLGSVPLALERGWDSFEERTSLERLFYRLRPTLSRLYGFDGLERFKRGFGPAHWEDEFMVVPKGTLSTARALLTLTRCLLRPWSE